VKETEYLACRVRRRNFRCDCQRDWTDEPCDNCRAMAADLGALIRFVREGDEIVRRAR
jgi:hypothetical protein